MLQILRRVFDFSDWSANHPVDPPPSDMLDASFDAQNQKINEIIEFVLAIQRPDGIIANEKVSWDSLHPDLREKIARELEDRAADVVRNATFAAENALKSLKDAQIAAESAKRASGTANSAVLEVSEAETVLSRAQALLAQAMSVENAIRRSVSALVAPVPASESSVGYSEAWAESSRLWAEHMPDTLPDNALKMMDISGEHWSARWWALRADNAFGMLTDLYLGVHEDPPTTDMTGGPITPGSIYYDSSKNQTYIWDGSQWVSLAMPQRAGMMTLWYVATAGQQNFPTSVADMQGMSFILSEEVPEGLDVHRAGLKLVPEGEWTADYATSTVHLVTPANAGDKVAIDIMVPVERLGPGAVENWSLNFSPAVDGTTTTFTLTVAAGGGPTVTIQRYEELMVSVDGVWQQPGAMFTATGDTVTFVTAPAADSVVFITWFRPDVGSGLATSMTGEEILAALDPVDGSGSGLDADLLDGEHGSFYRDWANLTGKPSTFPPASHSHPQSEVTNLVSDLALKAPLASPTLTGTVNVPTYSPPTASTLVASTAFVANAVSNFGATQDTRDDAQDALIAAKVNSTDYEDSDVLAKVKNVDGAASGLDADLLDGQHGSYYATQASQAAQDTLIASKVDAAAQDTRDDAQDAAIAAKIGEAPNDGQQYVRQSLAWAPVDVPPGTMAQDAPPASPDHGQLWYETDTGALYIWINDGTSSQWVQIDGPSLAVSDITPLGQCYLDASGANLLLSRENGNRLWINGRNETIPVAGVTLAPTGLTTTGGVSGTSFYYVYAYMNAGVMTLEWSGTVHAVDAASGIRVKSGDASRTLVGAFMAWAAGQFPTTGFHTNVTTAIMSVFNPKMKRGRTIGNPATASASYVELATSMRVFFLGFLGRPIRQIIETNAYNNVAGADCFLVTGVNGSGSYNGPGAFRLSASAATMQIRVHMQEVLYSSDGAYHSSPLGASSSGGTVTFPTMENFVEVWG